MSQEMEIGFEQLKEMTIAEVLKLEEAIKSYS